MRVRTSRFLFFASRTLLVVAATLGTAPAQLFAITFNIPLGLSIVEGNTGVREPFDTATGTAIRYQQVYSGAHFPGSVIDFGAFITDLCFRVDTTFGNGFLRTLPQIQINFSTTTRPVNGLSMVFQENVGPDDTIVFGPGSITLAGGHIDGSPGPQMFSIHFPLQTPFFYNPANGNLLLDVRNFDGRPTSYFDAHDSIQDGVSRIGGSLGSGTASFADTIGLVTQFEATVVPEPGTICLAILALAGTLLGYPSKGNARRTTPEEKPCRS